MRHGGDFVKIAEELVEQNELRGFIPDFIQNYGYAAWEHSLRAERNGALNLYIPLTSGTNVTAVIHSVMGGRRIKFRLITPHNIDKLLEKIPEGPNKPDYLTFKALFYDFNHRIYNLPATWVAVFDANGKFLYEYPVAEPNRAKGYHCITIGVGVGDMEEEGGDGGPGGGTDIQWEEHCTWVDDTFDNEEETPGDGGGCWYCDDPPPSGGGPGPDPEPEPKKPEKRTDCNGNAIANANNASDVLNSSNEIKSQMNILRDNAKNSSNEFGTTISKIGGMYVNSAFVQGGPYSTLLNMAPSTVYSVHTHPSGPYTGPSVTDLRSIFTTVNSYHGVLDYNLKGGIIFAHDGSEYLIAVDNRNNAANADNLNLFEPNDNGFFADNSMQSEYIELRNQLTSNNYSGNNAHDYALAYLLDKYNTGLKISKKEPETDGFKEMKTGQSSGNYILQICP